MNRPAFCIIPVILACGFGCSELAAQSADPEAADFAALGNQFQSDIAPLLRRSCGECHRGDDAEAEVDFDEFRSLAEVRKSPNTWQRTREMLRTGQMPPPESKQLSEEEQRTLQSWVRAYLTAESEARAGDPGSITLRRLSNDEYTYTLRDLTGIDSLDPAAEFPIDGAAGEGFTNVGDGLVMSPSLVNKYLDAAKEVAGHLVLLPDGIEFSRHSTRRDWTDEWLARIQDLYRESTEDDGGTAVDLQGIKFATNQGGRLAVVKYLDALLREREPLAAGRITIEEVAGRRGLSAKYLGTLWRSLSDPKEAESNFLLAALQQRLRESPADGAAAMAADIEGWQQAFWKFNSVGQIGRAGGPKAWMEPVTPVVTQQQLRMSIPETAAEDELVFYLVVADAVGGSDQDAVVFRSLRLEGGDQPPLLLRDAPSVSRRRERLRSQMLSQTSQYLAAVADYGRGSSDDSRERAVDLTAIAESHNVDSRMLQVWLRSLELSRETAVAVEGHFVKTERSAAGYDFISGWGTGETPSVIANSSDQEVRIPGISRPHSLAVHPSPTLFAAVGWQCPIEGTVQVRAKVADAHPECGNGVEYWVQRRSGAKTDTLWHGDFGTAGSMMMPDTTIEVRQGELVSLLVGPREGQHSCDLTHVEFTVTEVGGGERVWDLAADVSGDLLAGNPHDDQFGNRSVWHFYRGEVSSIEPLRQSVDLMPEGSLLWQWRREQDAARRSELALQVQDLVLGEPPAESGSPDAVLYQQLRRFEIPLDHPQVTSGIDPDPRFGRSALGGDVAAEDLVVKAPAIVEFRVAAELANGRDVAVTAEMRTSGNAASCTQVQLSMEKPESSPGLVPTLPLLVDAASRDGKSSYAGVLAAIEAYQNLFPPALCYVRIVPVDEVVTLTLFFREDDHLKRLMLGDDEAARLDRLWDQLLYISEEPLQLVVALEQLSEFATQDRPDLVDAFAPLREPIAERAERFRTRVVESEPRHWEAMMAIADRAWRRTLSDGEQRQLREFYQALRDQQIQHEPAIRLTLARVLTSPAFLYRREVPGKGKFASDVSDTELASRLSYFLWSSMPDDRLRDLARQGQLSRPSIFPEQVKRMLADDRSKRLAEQFACQWLHVRGFDQTAEKNEKLFPQFQNLRADMYEETVRFFDDMFRSNGSILGIVDADHAFVNESLARHYGIEGIEGSHWRRVDHVRGTGRGGVLGMASVLASQSGASRTSPILRGNWVYETLLGERLPRPPSGVPQLPDEAPDGLSARQLIEQHSGSPLCAKCHLKIDPFGFALEQYDAIGRLRPVAVDTKTQLPGGETIEGIEGLKDYLVRARRADLLHQFSRKLLGYALGREVQLSDEPLLKKMAQALAADGFRFHTAVDVIVSSPQFRQIRGQDYMEP